MAVKWTEEQQRVIDTRERNILVSAAAGSGKTAVLVARILSMITDETKPVDIDRLLVVTFTNAAAAEMRERIRDALEKRAEEEPENVHLQRQLVLVHNAKITTIHSFCLHVLRNHFQLVGIDPSFRVADEGEVILLEQEAVQETVEAAYERQDEGFRQFLECFATGKSDRIVEETVLALYHFALGQPWPREWLQSCREAYGGAEGDPLEWLRYIIEDTAKILSDTREQILEAIRIAEEPDGPYPYVKALQSDLETLEELCQGKDYSSYARLFRDMKPWARLSAKKDESISEEKKLQVQGMRGDIKDTVAGLRQRYYFDRPGVLKQELEDSGASVQVLTRLTEDFMERLEAKKAEKNILDFGDLEHLALQALVERKEGENIPTAAAREYAESFEEIMIDEYQDSNLVQELILQSVSGRGCGAHNLFMVGDVKQSIYRFRLARPELFMEKYKAYREANEAACRIDLHRNFRSRGEVLQSVNYIFRQIMTENLGGIVYDKDAALYPGAQFAPYPVQESGGQNEKDETESQNGCDFLKTEFLLLEADGQARQQEEARLVGKRIQEIVGQELIWDKEAQTYRPARYSDIVILLRTVSGWADTFGEVLGDMGIPCFTGSQKGYFSATEIRVVLSYLSILDNPVQDIPLAAVLRSAIGGICDEELAKIRSSSEQRYFYDCCQEYRMEGKDEALREKLEQFFGTFEGLRSKCSHTPVHLLIWELLEVTGYGAYAEALPAGEQRKANLDMLVEKAIAYEATSYRGLYHFVRYIENLKKYEVDYGEANVGSEAADTVRIMSIHKSKGLEFPIVFVSGMGKQFNESDIRSKVVMHPEFGIACDYVDTEQRTRQTTLLKKAIQQKTFSENLGEELRVLYVALTRAKEKLILTGAVPDAEEKINKWKTAAMHWGGELPYSRLVGASTYLDWVVPALLHSPAAEELFVEAGIDGSDVIRYSSDAAIPNGAAERESILPFCMRLVSSSENEQADLQERSDEALRLSELLNLDTDICYDKEAREYLDRVFHSAYPYEKNREIIGKLSVSELKKLSRMPEEEDAQELYRPETVIPLLPAFREEKEAISGAARGTVYHTFMENLDYSRKDELELQLEELITCGKMSEEEGAVLCLEDVRSFLQTESGKRMERAALAGMLFRERPFVLGVPADTIRSGWDPRETVLVQGIIDAYFFEDGQITVLDYKTDRVKHPRELTDKYRAQLDYYALALKRLTGCEVKDRIIYSFHLGRDIVL
ncbi:MAG: helicase-exonuclease AddAB subunit AddA [Lachnospiraceae bacterium]|nr:helicase-exonuclease AddAB subunit AddA [Lachnospiraceae bacterium]